MKRRTFFSTLSLFLLFIYLGIISISIISLQSMITRENNQVLDKHYFTTNSLIKDFSAVRARGGDLESSVVPLVSPYSRLSNDQKTELSFYNGEKHVLSSGFGVPIPSDYRLQEGVRHLEMQKIENRYCIIVDGYFPQPYESYRLLYQYDLTWELGEWWRMVSILFLVGSVLALILAVSLLLLIERLFRPLKQLSGASKSISSGNYTIRLPLGQGAELDDLAGSFNSMSKQIGEQMETLKEAVDSRQRFVDNFSHESRTPLTAIYGYAEYLQTTKPSQEETFSGLSNIMLQSRRLQSMSAQLLELAGLRGGEIVWDKIQLSHLFKQVVETLEKRLYEKDIKVTIVNNAEFLYGEYDLLRILFVNLIDNSITASEEGTKIHLAAALEKEKVMITIEDFGKGIDKEHLSHITEPFYRGDKARRRSDGGTGLGLSICAEIVKRHHASIEFKSTVGKGTIVLLTFTTSLHPDDKLTTSPSYTLGSGYPQIINRSDCNGKKKNE